MAKIPKERPKMHIGNIVDVEQLADGGSRVARYEDGVLYQTGTPGLSWNGCSSIKIDRGILHDILHKEIELIKQMKEEHKLHKNVLPPNKE